MCVFVFLSLCIYVKAYIAEPPEGKLQISYSRLDTS